MKRSSFAYNLINVLVLLVAALIFFLNYRPAHFLSGMRADEIVVILMAVIIVHFLKAVRLYLALYGNGLSLSDYCKTYCKVTPVSILLPFKSGELYRMYCYGYQINNMLKGVVTVLLDRFMDTIALVTLMIATWIIYGGVIIPLAYLLMIFLLGVIIIYGAFPGIYSYWKKYILRAVATPRKLRALRFLEHTNRAYIEMANVTKGRGIILYMLSLLAWVAEISSVVILNRLDRHADVVSKIAEYLTSALGNNHSIELRLFIFISVILMIVIYLIVKAIDTFIKERH